MAGSWALTTGLVQLTVDGSTLTGGWNFEMEAGGAGSSGSRSGSSADSVASTASESETAESDTVSSGGDQPTLSWPAVEGASLYSVVVADAEGVSFWGWQGTDLSVTVGDGAPDPLVSPDMTWSVIALDADGAPLWDSGPVPV